ncbi:hypothetical protein SAICODRAFT_36569 [Saitoella complicata NRRL Y-17804]|uniref:uncharacterized protein n=1 Tax=Saitoella complicata (strain BCRC 22490 / CBS 7301 / JCM 7358 / NBRC 10748 / NRRL Y-17804) TaxID=698492 RepID=UPI000866C9E3|nr:uncharacterized protein SAICODRAFT_36569 [Saitoella complicata NRRL Y-17804]ODQ51212.1 hypothetical protein SAICODRAFT_36569 [Saitoella complicata NRRL Y-17804]
MFGLAPTDPAFTFNEAAVVYPQQHQHQQFPLSPTQRMAEIPTLQPPVFGNEMSSPAAAGGFQRPMATPSPKSTSQQSIQTTTARTSFSGPSSELRHSHSEQYRLSGILGAPALETEPHITVDNNLLLELLGMKDQVMRQAEAIEGMKREKAMLLQGEGLESVITRFNKCLWFLENSRRQTVETIKTVSSELQSLQAAVEAANKLRAEVLQRQDSFIKSQEDRMDQQEKRLLALEETVRNGCGLKPESVNKQCGDAQTQNNCCPEPQKTNSPKDSPQGRTRSELLSPTNPSLAVTVSLLQDSSREQGHWIETTSNQLQNLVTQINSRFTELLNYVNRRLDATQAAVAMQPALSQMSMHMDMGPVPAPTQAAAPVPVPVPGQWHRPSPTAIGMSTAMAPSYSQMQPYNGFEEMGAAGMGVGMMQQHMHSAQQPSPTQYYHEALVPMAAPALTRTLSHSSIPSAAVRRMDQHQHQQGSYMDPTLSEQSHGYVAHGYDQSYASPTSATMSNMGPQAMLPTMGESTSTASMNTMGGYTVSVSNQNQRRASMPNYMGHHEPISPVTPKAQGRKRGRAVTLLGQGDVDAPKKSPVKRGRRPQAEQRRGAREDFEDEDGSGEFVPDGEMEN